LAEARSALDDYRREHEIISAERQENEVLARLDGLNRALNNAIEEEAKTRAYLDTLREAITRGAAVVPKGDRSEVEAMASELAELQAELVELTKRYTPDYIEKQPRLRAVPERIEELNGQLAQALIEGRAAELANATQAHEAARQTVAGLQRQLDERKQQVAQFNSIYATHQALAEDLAGLEQLNRDTQARLVQVEVRQVERYPQVSVIDRPAPDSERIGPDYLLLLGGTLGAALGLGVFAVWLQGFLSPQREQPAYITLSGVHLYPQDVSGQLGYSTQPDPRLAQDTAPRLEGRGNDSRDKPEAGDEEGRPG
jgi:succinoglycan biosynthesis transport protein ExoP